MDARRQVPEPDSPIWAPPLPAWQVLSDWLDVWVSFLMYRMGMTKAHGENGGLVEIRFSRA